MHRCEPTKSLESIAKSEALQTEHGSSLAPYIEHGSLPSLVPTEALEPAPGALIASPFALFTEHGSLPSPVPTIYPGAFYQEYPGRVVGVCERLGRAGIVECWLEDGCLIYKTNRKKMY